MIPVTNAAMCNNNTAVLNATDNYIASNVPVARFKLLLFWCSTEGAQTGNFSADSIGQPTQ